MKNKGLATAILAACALGAAWTSVLAASGGGFLVRLASHGLIAATIGGLADWFAVTAIFKKPLGISWRTDILRKNRVRIMGELKDFAASDLLSPENIMRTLSRQDFAAQLTDYLTLRGGRERILALIDAAIVSGTCNIDADDIARRTAPIVRRALERVRLDALAESVQATLSDEARGMTRAFAPIARSVLGGEAVQAALTSHIAAFRESYSGGNWMRGSMFEMLGLDDERIRSLINSHLDAWLTGIENGKGAAYESLVARISSFMEEFSKSGRLLAVAEEFKREKIDAADIPGIIAAMIESARRENLPAWREMAREMAVRRMERFVSDEDERRRMNEWTLRTLDKLLREHRDMIPDMISKQLDRLSDDEMVHMAEEKVSSDLQMIRINGSVTGAIVGMALFVLEGMCGL